MKLIRIFIALVLVAGTTQTFAKSIEDRHLTGFHAVNVSGSFDVIITQGSTESVRVEAPADVIREVLTDVKGGTLNIYNKNHVSWGNIFGNKKIVVYVSIKDVTGISLTGSGDVSFKGGINANNLRIQLTGSGDLGGRVNAKYLEGSVTGSGDVKLSGHADDQKVNVTGSGDYTAGDLTTINTMVSVGGSGDAAVNASESLKASVTGSGDIHYSGHPKNVAKSKTGSGDINGH
ncbi:MAG: head GIN domain-containing protein [Bacteroidota bacterium]